MGGRRNARDLVVPSVQGDVVEDIQDDAYAAVHQHDVAANDDAEVAVGQAGKTLLRVGRSIAPVQSRWQAAAWALALGVPGGHLDRLFFPP